MLKDICAVNIKRRSIIAVTKKRFEDTRRLFFVPDCHYRYGFSSCLSKYWTQRRSNIVSGSDEAIWLWKPAGETGLRLTQAS